jgi:putative endonuclease
MTMVKQNNKKTGDAGEELAREYLEKHGFRIIGTKYKLFCGEIDILAQDRKTLVVIEVKTVRGAGFGLAQDLVRYKKQQKLRNLARALMQEYQNWPIRIDVIGVDLSDSNDPKIEHLVNAVEGEQ